MSKQKSVQNYLACEFHGEKRAGQVCGECGVPLCDDCSNSVKDITLNDYSRGGLATLVGGLLLLVAVPIGVDAVPRLFWLSLANLVGKPLYIQGGLKLGSMFVGVGLLATIRFRLASSGSGLGGLQLLNRNTNRRTVCDSCNQTKRRQRWIGRAVGLLVLALIGYGLYLSFTGLFFRHLRIVGAGVALGVLRHDLVVVASALIE